MSAIRHGENFDYGSFSISRLIHPMISDEVIIKFPDRKVYLDECSDLIEYQEKLGEYGGVVVLSDRVVLSIKLQPSNTEERYNKLLSERDSFLREFLKIRRPGDLEAFTPNAK